MKNRNVIIYLTGIVISMVIAIIFITQTQNKINKYEYVVDKSNLGSNIAIMVQDHETQEYLKTNTIPTGNYKLNEEKTNCVGKGIVSDYDPVAGTIKFETEAADECYLYFDENKPTLASVCMSQNMSYCISKNYLLDDSIYYHSSSLANSAADNSYRYAGADPDNYVCFAGDDCSDENNIFRIIGIFNNQIKLIKYTSIGEFAWNTSGNSSWKGSSLEKYLNDEYLNTLGTKTNLITDKVWNVNGSNSWSLTTAQDMLKNEMNNSSIHTAKIGLFYVSDYMYATRDKYWKLVSYYNDDSTKDYRAAKDDNWLYFNRNTWTISKSSSNSAMFIFNGRVYAQNVSYNNCYVYPAFYLKSTVKIIEGEGTNTNPWIIGA